MKKGWEQEYEHGDIECKECGGVMTLANGTVTCEECGNSYDLEDEEDFMPIDNSRSLMVRNAEFGGIEW